MRFPQRALSQRRHAFAKYRCRRCVGRFVILRRCNHHEHISKMEDRTGNRGIAVEDRSERDTRLSTS